MATARPSSRLCSAIRARRPSGACEYAKIDRRRGFAAGDRLERIQTAEQTRIVAVVDHADDLAASLTLECRDECVGHDAAPDDEDTLAARAEAQATGRGERKRADHRCQGTRRDGGDRGEPEAREIPADAQDDRDRTEGLCRYRVAGSAPAERCDAVEHHPDHGGRDTQGDGPRRVRVPVRQCHSAY